MAKILKDILSKKLEGVKSSKVVPGSTGVDPGVDYEPKAGDEQKFVAVHNTEKHADFVGNKDDVYQATNVKYSLDTPQNKRMGKKEKKAEADELQPNRTTSVKEAWDRERLIDHHKGRHERAVASLMKYPNDKSMVNTADIERTSRQALKKMGIDVDKPKHPAVYEAKETEEVKCNHSAKGVNCPVHGMAECAMAQKINENKGKTTGALDEVLTKKTPAGTWIKDFIKSDNPKFAGKSKKERTKQALAAYYAKQRNEDLAMPLLGGMSDNSGGSGGSPGGTSMMTDDTHEEIQMVRAELKAIANKATHLLMKMPDNMHIEPWIQAKIAKAKMAVGEVHDHMLYSDEHQEDEQADTPITLPTEIHSTFPGLNQDNALGMNV